jgi:hypothetical protein
LARLLSLWMARATSSLPVPLSPAMNTDESVGATFSIVLKTRCIFSELPTSSANAYWCSA